MEKLPTRFMIKPAPWAIEALAAEVEKHPTVEWRDVANFIFDVGCRALGYGGDEDEADNASAE